MSLEDATRDDLLFLLQMAALVALVFLLGLAAGWTTYNAPRLERRGFGIVTKTAAKLEDDE